MDQLFMVGSVLSPILFTVYIDDLLSEFEK